MATVATYPLAPSPAVLDKKTLTIRSSTVLPMGVEGLGFGFGVLFRVHIIASLTSTSSIERLSSHRDILESTTIMPRN